jgi:hypothetical protein
MEIACLRSDEKHLHGKPCIPRVNTALHDALNGADSVSEACAISLKFARSA